jgi:uncharacterized protein YqgC (DUF456 family)
LLAVALLIGLLFDRVVLTYESWSFSYLGGLGTAFGVFWLCWLAAFYAFSWKRLKVKPELWYVAVCSAALCVWNFVYSGNVNYRAITMLALPAVLMAHAQYAAGDYTLKDSGKLAAAWLIGWVVKPFSAIPECFGASAALLSGENRSTVRKALIGAGAAALLLCVI